TAPSCKVMHNKKKTYKHRYNSSPCYTSNSHIKPEKEYWGKNCINNCSYKHCIHCFLGIARSPHHRVEVISKAHKHIPQQHYLEIVPCIRQRELTCSKRDKYRIEIIYEQGYKN